MYRVKKVEIQTGENNDVLRKLSEPILDLSKTTPLLKLNLHDFVKEMKKQLLDEKGLGIAAPQLGENIQIIITRLNHDTEREILFVMINPKITWKSWNGDIKVMLNSSIDDVALPTGAGIDQEGCLSLPGYFANVIRADEVSVDFFDGRELLKKNIKGKTANLNKITLNLQGLNARIVQHEIDHLNGILICDRVED